jgi:hypothetical protein
VAIVKCSECKREISSEAETCPHCGKKKPPGRVLVLLAWIVPIPFMVVLFVVIIAIIGDGDKKAVATGSPVPSTETAPEEPPLTQMETANAYSSFVSELQAKLFSMQLLTQSYIGRIKQDAGYGDLGAQRKDSSELKDALMQSSQEMSRFSGPSNIPEDAIDVFSDTSEAAISIAGDIVEMAVDLDVSSNYGASDDGDMQRLAHDLKTHRSAFQKTVLTSYQHFGIDRQALDMKTLTIKN